MSFARVSLGKYFDDRIGERQLLLVGENHQRRAGELLRHGADGEHRARRHRVGGAERLDAVALGEDDLAVLHDADGQADEMFVGNGAANDAVELGRHDGLRGGGARAGNKQRGRKEGTCHGSKRQRVNPPVEGCVER